MSDKIYISSDDLKSAMELLKSKSSELYNEYRNNVQNVLVNSEDCFYVSGLDTQSILNSFNDIYNELNSQISELVNLVNNRVIPEYDQLNSAIVKMFNSDFASEIQRLLPGIKSN